MTNDNPERIASDPAELVPIFSDSCDPCEVRGKIDLCLRVKCSSYHRPERLNVAFAYADPMTKHLDTLKRLCSTEARREYLAAMPDELRDEAKTKYLEWHKAKKDSA